MVADYPSDSALPRFDLAKLLLLCLAMRAIGIVLIVLGVIGLLYGGLTWTRKDKVVDAGPIEITADKHESLPIPPIAGGVMLVIGAVLLMKR